jgi:hypothetical protein
LTITPDGYVSQISEKDYLKTKKKNDVTVEDYIESFDGMLVSWDCEEV